MSRQVGDNRTLGDTISQQDSPASALKHKLLDILEASVPDILNVISNKIYSDIFKLYSYLAINRQDLKTSAQKNKELFPMFVADKLPPALTQYLKNALAKKGKEVDEASFRYVFKEIKKAASRTLLNDSKFKIQVLNILKGNGINFSNSEMGELEIVDIFIKTIVGKLDSTDELISKFGAKDAEPETSDDEEDYGDYGDEAIDLSDEELDRRLALGLPLYESVFEEGDFGEEEYTMNDFLNILSRNIKVSNELNEVRKTIRNILLKKVL
jgi:Ca2+-binding EF-hand superfamily protein